jgi:aspartyl-tRNA(Asn)/glutamyl-tRNA(Gln) amidotransferase subunit C
MAIDRAEAARIASLARLAIPDAELDRVAAQLSQVLDFVARLEELDLAGLEPSAFAPAGEPLRSDEPDGRTLAPGAATAGAPEAEAGYFLVPPVVEALEP